MEQTKKISTQAAKKQSKEQRHDAPMRRGVAGPAHSSTTQVLEAMHLGVGTDFDDGVRALEQGFSEATEADAITERIQSLAVKEHNDSQRKRMNNLPT